MKILIQITILLFSVLNVFGQNDSFPIKVKARSFPTNLNSSNFNVLGKFEGKIVAFDGIIDKVVMNSNNMPLYKLRINNNSYLWTVLLFKNETNKIGDKIRVVGYVSPTNISNDTDKKYLEGKYMVIAFGLLDFKTLKLLFLGEASDQKQEWIEGKIPSPN